MRSAILTLMILATALSGCTTDDAPAADSDGATDGTADATESNQQAATGPLLFDAEDPWGDATEIDLGSYTDTPQSVTGQCIGIAGNPWYQCLHAPAETFAPIPLGTESLEIALSGPAGTYHVQVYAPSLAPVYTEDQSGSDITWTHEITPGSWETDAKGQLALTVWRTDTGEDRAERTIQVTAVKDPEWVPTPAPTPWDDPANRTYTAEGSMVLHWSNASYDWPGNTQGGPSEGFGSQQVRVTPIQSIPAGSTHLTIGVKALSVSGCTYPGENACFTNFKWSTNEGVAYHYSDDGNPEYGPASTIRTFTTEDYLVPDGAYAAETGSLLDLWLYSCNAVYEAMGGRGMCDFENTDASFEASVLVEAWRGEPDLAAFKERLGVS